MPCGGNAGGYAARGRATRHAIADGMLQAARRGVVGFGHRSGSGDTASSNRCLGQCDKERRLDALGRRLALRHTAGIVPVICAWTG
jgi:hypothetical protein